jgi:hypothetical protein
MMAMETYKEAHRNVLKIEKELSALREERTNLPEDGSKGRMKAQKRIFSKQSVLVTRWGNASQKRNKALSALEKILKEQAVLESK